MTAATKNAHDWHCEDHDTFGWRGEACRQCPEAPSEITTLRTRIAELEASPTMAAVRDAIQTKALQENERLSQRVAELEKERDELHYALENCRLFAARNRKESWALFILGFLAEAGVVGSITREEKTK